MINEKHLVNTTNIEKITEELNATEYSLKKINEWIKSGESWLDAKALRISRTIIQEKISALKKALKHHERTTTTT